MLAERIVCALRLLMSTRLVFETLGLTVRYKTAE
ncbi:hypothetical protein Mal52_11160 [Symmachiella dynata]|uniref:Uncharacterized protein n=1 Tax=Symmachiella dynata TaxID=2527995 RepID=A0A517ZJK1_9PLAN|nr:hypothetical protein Mal52_11160 [Symmachiella dynata]